MKKICVIGGGAAGLMAAYAAAKQEHQVILFEKNEKLGKKIYITGKGRCNFTNDVSAEEFFPNIVRGEKFLKGAIYTFPPQKSINFFENYGLSIKTERGNRVFPASDHASDVTKTLEKACKSVGVEIHLKEKVERVIAFSNIINTPDIIDNTASDKIPMSRVVAVKTEKSEYACDYAIVCTGGLSYPTTGSTGDGYLFAQSLGHSVTDLKCGLCGVNVKGEICKALQGLALKNVALTAKYLEKGSQEKVIYSAFGEMLFTHFGISGPIVLSLSSLINRMPIGNITLFLDLKPALDEQTLDKRILRDFEKYKNKQIENALVELLPSKLIAFVLETSGISPKKQVNAITKKERENMVKVLKNFPLKPFSLRGFEEAIITSGGVNLTEINPKTMESKMVSGLKFCGEVLDVDAFTGGFNMQIAFATGFIAGSTIK